MPPQPLSKKRKLDYDASEFTRVNISPSEFSKPSNFQNLMTRDGPGREVYIQNRPIDFESVPLTLISPIFGRLSDDLFTHHEDFRSEDFAPARELVDILSELEKDEASRKEPFLKWLLATLPDIEREDPSRDAPLQPHKARLSTAIIKGKSSSKHDFVTDGHVELGDNLLLLVEAKPELGKGSSNPHWQAMAYVRAYYMQKRCFYRVGRSPMPAILITFYGPCIDASAAIVCPDGSVQVQALTPGLRVDCDYRDDRQRNLLAGFVRALRNAFEGLKKFYESPPGPIPDPCGYRSNQRAAIDRPFPYKDTYTDDQGSECAFKYKSRLMRGALIFLAEHTEPEANAKQIVVKFTRTYSKAVHNLLAGNGFAPELFAVEDLAGGWKMVVMEYLSGWVMLGEKPLQERQKYKERLESALRVIHDHGLVHGDVRWPNILVSEDDIKFVDFDHCGEVEVVRYPREWDHRQRLEDAKEGDLIQKAHDVWMLDRIFDHSVSSPRRSFYM
ncbi:hypothetical protein BJV74DRAFT_869417 [Russula compacta]|nr:hypothetical protein BJV74DRAFT_869417 [Russula compacta]